MLKSYFFVKDIASGSFGQVEEVEDEGGKRYAKKTFAIDLDVSFSERRTELLKRFEREVQVQKYKLDHENIMPIIEHELDSQQPFFIMPLADKNFTEKIEEDRQKGRIDINPWLDILAGVEYLHAKGCLHRDLKPSNILLLGDKWVIADLGLISVSYKVNTHRTKTATTYFTEYYAAPEQRNSLKSATEMSDIFALGCMIYDYFAKPFPYSSSNLPDRAPFSQINIPGPYGEIISKCTHVNPNERYLTIAELREVLLPTLKKDNSLILKEREKNIIDLIQASPTEEGLWDDLFNILKTSTSDEKEQLFGPITNDVLKSLHETKKATFSKYVTEFCDWVSNTRFDFSFVDLLADKLTHIFNISTSINLKKKAIETLIRVSVEHNRWHAMGKVVKILCETGDEFIAEEIASEIEYQRYQEESQLVQDLKTISKRLASPPYWHKGIAEQIRINDVERARLENAADSQLHGAELLMDRENKS
jgi:eukaryotic-like serine/threonine-protein kinase